MLLSEVVQMYSPKAEMVCLITSEEVEYLLSQKLGIKKSDFEVSVWNEIVSRSRKAVANHFKDTLLVDLIGRGLAEYVKEGSISIERTA